MTAVRSTFLRSVVAFNAAVCGLSGAVLAFDSQMLAGPLGLPAALTQPAGVFLVGYAVLLAWLASRPALPRAVVWSLVGFELLWAVESIALVALGWEQPTPLGLGVVIAQAVGAIVIADLLFIAIRRSRVAA